MQRKKHTVNGVAFRKGGFCWVCTSPNSSLEMVPLPSLSKSLNASSTALGTAAIYPPSMRGTPARRAAHKCYDEGLAGPTLSQKSYCFPWLYLHFSSHYHRSGKQKCQNIQQNDVKMTSNCENSCKT